MRRRCIEVFDFVGYNASDTSIIPKLVQTIEERLVVWPVAELPLDIIDVSFFGVKKIDGRFMSTLTSMLLHSQFVEEIKSRVRLCDFEDAKRSVME